MKDKQSNTRQLYFTSDALAFFDRASAEQHAEALADKQITSKTGDEIESTLQAGIDESTDHFLDQLCFADDLAA